MNERQLKEVRMDVRALKLGQRGSEKKNNPHDQAKVELGAKEYRELLQLLVRVK